MPSIIDARIAARMHQHQIDMVARSERVALYVGEQVLKVGREIKEIVSRGRVDVALQIIPLLQRLPIVAVAAVDEMLLKMAQHAHRETTKILVKTVPRYWWQRARPSLPESMFEAKKSKRLKKAIAYVADPDHLRIRNDLEPILSGRLSDEEYEDLIKETVIPPITRDRARQFIRSRNPATGETWEERMRGLSRKIGDPNTVATQLAAGISRGEGIPELRKRVDDIIGPLHGSSLRVARTEARRVAELANRESWSSMGDMLEGAQIVAVLDENTREEHALRNGEIYWVDGDPDISTMPALPDEPNCRCIAVPVLKPPDEIVNDPVLAAEFQTAAGDSILDPAAYDSWFSRASEGRRKDAVGAGRYNFVKGLNQAGIDPDWTDFIGNDGKLLTVKTLRKESPVDRADRKNAVAATLRRREDAIRKVTQGPFFSRKILQGGS